MCIRDRYVELPGGVMRQESILGIPVNRVVPLNAYDDVAALAERLQNAGASSLVLNYVNWAKGGTESRLTVDMAPEGGLGGSSAFRRMLQDIEALSGVNLYLDLNLTDMMHNQWGYSTKYSASQSVMKEPAIQYPYKMSTFQIDSTGGLRFLLSPLRFGKAMEQTLSKATKLSVYGFSANSLAVSYTHLDVYKRQWLLSNKQQPLELDYFLLHGETAKVPSPKGNFWENLVFGFKQFLAAFSDDYDSMADWDEGTTDVITVWTLSLIHISSSRRSPR